MNADVASVPRTADASARPWSTAQLIAFRVLFCVGGLLLLLGVYGNLILAPVLDPVKGVFGRLWALLTGTDFASPELSGTGDTLSIWQYHLGAVVVGLVLAALWSYLDRRRTDYRALAGLLWEVARFGLAIGMIFYGVAKLIPTQMGMMDLPTYALQPAGDISRMNMLWGFMGASDGYSIVTGLIETASGLLLLSRRTWILGALGSIVSMAQVTLMDTFYNVPVKFLAFEFLVIAVAILAPVWPNLVNAVLGRPASAAPPLWRPAGADRTWLRRIGKTVTTLVLLVMLVGSLILGALGYRASREVRAPVDGTWHATSFTVDGRDAAAAGTGAAQGTPGALPWINLAITYRGAGSLESFGFSALVTQSPTAKITAWHVTVDEDTLAIKQRESDPETRLQYRQSDPDHLTLTGTVDGRDVRAEYERRPMARASEKLRFTHDEPDREMPVPDFP